MTSHREIEKLRISIHPIITTGVVASLIQHSIGTGDETSREPLWDD